jgi:hypothetical protein
MFSFKFYNGFMTANISLSRTPSPMFDDLGTPPAKRYFHVSSYACWDSDPIPSQRYLYEQPTTQSCGPSCVNMIANDVFGTLTQNQKSTLKKAVLSNRLYDENDMAPLMNSIGLIGVAAKFVLAPDEENDSVYINGTIEHRHIRDRSALLNSVLRIIETTRNSVILAITHPKIDGHYIIVDGYDGSGVDIRDPLFGEAFKVSFPKLAAMTLVDIQLERFFYFPKA